MEAVTEADARRALARAGVPADGPLEKAFTYSNDVWIGDRHVVVIGRPDGLGHQARILEALPPEVPHAGVVGFESDDRRDVLLLRRVPGIPWSEAWPGLTTAARHALVDQLAGALAALHAMGGVERFRHPSTEAPTIRAYQQPPSRFGALLEAARRLPVADPAFLDDLDAFMAARLPAFDDDSPGDHVLVHADIHWENLLCDDGRLTAVLDFETARPAPHDLELDTILRFSVWPHLPVREDREPGMRPEDFAPVPGWLRDSYPALFAHPRLADRLEAYAVMYDLRQALMLAADDPEARLWRQLKELVAGNGYISSSVGTP